jgi:hypothetical protein
VVATEVPRFRPFPLNALEAAPPDKLTEDTFRDICGVLPVLVVVLVDMMNC